MGKEVGAGRGRTDGKARAFCKPQFRPPFRDFPWRSPVPGAGLPRRMKAHLPNHPTQLYLIRHGEVETKYHRVFGGSRIDMALSPLGQEQAAALARWMEGSKLDALYASP